jgi:hypothetical protein
LPRWLEFHDAELLALAATPQSAIIRLRGYIHQWQQTPAGWVGTGWNQHVLLHIESPTSGVPPIEPARISDGTLACGPEAYRSLLRVPFVAAAPSHLRLELANGGVLEVAGARVSVEAEGDATYVEDLPDDLRPDQVGEQPAKRRGG